MPPLLQSDRVLQFVIGLDLGQAADPSALIALERALIEYPLDYVAPDGRAHGPYQPPVYTARALKRYALGTEYTQIATDLAAIVQREPFKGNVDVVLDHTGVGRGVIEIVRQALEGTAVPIVAVTITGGTHPAYDSKDRSWHVPKRDLVGVLQALLQTNRLRLAAFPERDLLIKELLNFKIKVTAAGNDTYEAWREGDHDDMVLAAALACWWGENHMAVTLPAQSTPYNKPLADTMARLNRIR